MQYKIIFKEVIIKRINRFILLLSFIPFLNLSCKDSNEPTIDDAKMLTNGNYTGAYKFIWNYETEEEDSMECDTEIIFDESGYIPKI
jgi:hypothetical protein